MKVKYKWTTSGFYVARKGEKGLTIAGQGGGNKRKGDNNFQVKHLAASDRQQFELKVAKIGRINEKDVVQAIGDKFKTTSKL